MNLLRISTGVTLLLLLNAAHWNCFTTEKAAATDVYCSPGLLDSGHACIYSGKLLYNLLTNAYAFEEDRTTTWSSDDRTGSVSSVGTFWAHA
jgi:hypothetical protein